MFESIAATLINRFLGSYIENFDLKSLNIGIWSGDVRLKNLRLKKESLDKFNLPLDVKFGHLGELTLQIPWSNLKGKPVKVIIEDVYLLASPIIINEYDAVDDNRRTQQLKQDKLRDLEAVQSTLNATRSDSLAADESFTESLVTKIVDNLQVTIKNIHVRYEDDSVLTENPYSAGFTLEELSASSTDENWLPSFIAITQSFTRKLLVLRNFACYMNTSSESLFQEDPDALLKSLKDYFSEQQATQYLLKPVSGKGHFVIHKAGSTSSHPHIKGELFFDEFGLEFDSSQYRDILWTALKFHWYQRTWKFRKLRPKVSAEEDPKRWFKYAAESILNEIHQKNYRWSWDHFKSRRDQRKAYVGLWKSKLLKRTFSPEEEKQFVELEEALLFEDIKFYRLLARNEFRKENVLAPKSNAPNAKQAGGWFSWWGGGQANEVANALNPEDAGGLDLTLTDEQRQALYDTIDYDESKSEVADAHTPRDRVKAEIYINLKRGGISLRQDKISPALTEVVLEECQTQFFQRPDSFVANFQLKEFRVEDGVTKSLYKHIVSAKHDHVHNDASAISQSKEDPFFKFSFENNPLDGKADLLLTASLKSMTIFYNCAFIEEVIKFFTPPKIHLDTIGAIMNAAEATMEGLTSQTRLGLQYVLEEHKTIDLKLDLQAPLILLPLDPTSWKSPIAILDAGHLSVTSDLVDKSVIEEFSAKEAYDESDWKKFNNIMYDRFKLHLQDAQFLVGPTIKSTIEQLHTKNTDNSAVILENLSCKLSLGVSILPDATNLARFKVSGTIPNLNLALNDFQYKTLMTLIDTCIPDLPSEDSERESIFESYGLSSDNNSISDVESESTSLSKSTDMQKQQQQHMFEFDFEIIRVALSMSRCIDGVTLETESLIDLIGDSLTLSFFKTENDMHLDLALTDINLIDHIEKSGIKEFERLISSNNFSATDKIERAHPKLFKLNYDRKQRIVELDGRKIEVFDQDIDLQMSALKCVLSRKSLLSLLNFTLNTFTDPDAEETPADELKHNDFRDDSVAPQKIKVSVGLDGITVVLNEDGIKLATLQLGTALIDVLVLPEEMKVKGSIGALTLHDDTNEGSPRDSKFRKLISLEGDNLALFEYHAFDLAQHNEPYQSYIEVISAKTRINFVEDAFQKIFAFLNKFQKMKAIYDDARELALNQTTQIESPSKIKMNVLVRAPVIHFPKLTAEEGHRCDNLIAELGEFYVNNIFETRGDVVHNLIEAGLRNISLSTSFFFDEVEQTESVVEKLDIKFDVDCTEPEAGTHYKIDGTVSELDMHLSELQLRYIYNLQNSIMSVFESSDDDSLEDIEEDADNANAVMKHNQRLNRRQSSRASVPTIPQIRNAIVETNPDVEAMSLTFKIPLVTLTIYNNTSEEASLDHHQLCSLAIKGLTVGLEMKHDTNFVSDVDLTSFTITDVRENSENKFTEIIPSILGDKNQFDLHVSSSGTGEGKTMTVILNIEQPKTVLALDLIFDVQAFAEKGLELDDTFEVEKELPFAHSQASLSSSESLESNVVMDTIQSSGQSKVGVSVNIINPSIILLADSSKPDTEALVFKVEQVSFSSQNIMSLAVKNVGMYVAQMNDFASQGLRIIDDFSISLAVDARNSTPTEFMTKVHLSIDPLLFRISSRDIRLALQIADRANHYYIKSHPKEANTDGAPTNNISEDFRKKLSKYAPSSIPSYFVSTRRRDKDPMQSEEKIIVKGEEFDGVIGGARLVLLGDVHELPVLDMGLKPFDINIANWSTDLSAEVHVQTYVNIYNYSKSVWEPLLENWPISIYATKTTNPKARNVIEIVSRDTAQLSVSSRSVALLSQIASSITSDAPVKPREQITPYSIKNETGYDIKVWIDRGDGLKDNLQSVKQNESINWEFEDWRTIRQNLDTDNSADVLGIELLESTYEILLGIRASGEGEAIYKLQPDIKGVHNRVVCDIKLGSDNVKTIFLRSTIVLQNNADTAIVVKAVNDNDNQQEVTIPAGTSAAMPLQMVYDGKFKIKPSMKTDFNWCNETFSWRDLMNNGRSLSCSTITTGELSLYYFQAEAQYDENEPLTKIYPHATIIISAPLEVENLLPFDLNFRLYDKSSRRDWTGTVEKGTSTLVQVVTLENLLLLSVEPINCGFGKSEFAVINARARDSFQRELITTMKHEDGAVVKLKLHYPKTKASRTSLKVSIYAPYVILNRTGEKLQIQEALKFGQLSTIDSREGGNLPHVFSYESDRRLNRCLVRVGESQWSEPVSLEAIGQSIGMSANLSGRSLEMNFGVTVAEGEGKYKLTKVITFAPRFILRNCLTEGIIIAENGSSKQTALNPGELLPLYRLRRNIAKTMIMKFADQGVKWSSPFAINDVGQVFLKVQKENKGQQLLKVNIVTENATIFVQIEDANNSWPFSIRNFTESEFYIYQSNPNVDLNGEIVKNDVEYKPIYYKVPAKSVMPYSYDYPNAVVKEINIRSHGRERGINLAEIGNLKPFRLPETKDEPQAIVDLNVVADGPTQSLVITKYDPSLSLYKLQDGNNSVASLKQLKFEVDEKDENYHTKVFTRFEGFGISLINTKLQELCYVNLRGVELRYNESDLYQNLSVKAKWIQIDNQLYGGIFPIIVYPTVVPKSGKEMDSHPSFSASVCKVKDDSHGVLFIKYATVLLQEFSIEVDEDFLFALLEFSKFPGASWNVEGEERLCDENLEVPEPEKLSETSDIYFEALHLQPTLLNLSFVRTERVNADDRANSQNTLMFFVNMLTMAIGNINDAPIKLNALFIENIRQPLPILMESISTHYGQSFFYQVHKILGSADVLGNPVGLFHNLSSGVLDIFYEPYQGFVINDRPQEIGIGLAKGGLSFLKKSVFGFSDSFAKFTGSLAKGLSVATLDRSFQEKRRLNQRRNRPKDALYGISSGANSFFESVSSGVTGIAQAPIEGALKDGAGGFLIGLGKGVIGFPTKTAIGLFDLASNVSEGIRNTTTVFDRDGLDKVRLPRYISHDGIIRSYSAREAQGQYWLKSIEGGAFFDQTYLAHLVLSGEEKAILVTFAKIILFEINTLKVQWLIPFENVRQISLETTGVAIKTKNNRGPFVPVPDKRSREFLYNKIRVAVDKYNSQCQVTL